jgi:hypothetical protein
MATADSDRLRKYHCDQCRKTIVCKRDDIDIIDGKPICFWCMSEDYDCSVGDDSNVNFNRLPIQVGHA